MALHGSHIPRIVARRQPSPPPSPIDHQVALSLSPFLLKYISILAPMVHVFTSCLLAFFSSTRTALPMNVRLWDVIQRLLIPEVCCSCRERSLNVPTEAMRPKCASRPVLESGPPP